MLLSNSRAIFDSYKELELSLSDSSFILFGEYSGNFDYSADFEKKR